MLAAALARYMVAYATAAAIMEAPPAGAVNARESRRAHAFPIDALPTR